MTLFGEVFVDWQLSSGKYAIAIRFYTALH